MKKILISIFILFCFSTSYAQDTQGIIKEIQRLTLANDSLQKQIIKPLKDSIAVLHTNYVSKQKNLEAQINVLKMDTTAIYKKIKKNEKDIAKLNKNKVVADRDSLQKQVKELNIQINQFVQKVQEKEQLLVQEKQEKEKKVNEANTSADQRAKAERERGRLEVLENTVKTYKDKNFDELIEHLSKQTVQHDKQNLVQNTELMPVLIDLEKYYNAQELLNKKLDIKLIEYALQKLTQIKRPSTLLNKLKSNLDAYKDFNDELYVTIENLIKLDHLKLAQNEEKIQNQKFKEIMTELSNYMYNYYDYVNYPYLSAKIIEILKRKRPNPDADISYLLEKLK